jgi:hypothetical protein
LKFEQGVPHVGKTRLYILSTFFVLLLAGTALRAAEVKNLALSALGARALSWEPGIPVVPEHEPAKVNDGSMRSYWLVRPESLPADLGIEWPQPQKISCVVVRYFDGKMVRGPAVARTQQWAQLEYWDGREWRDLNAQLFGQETSTVRYVFEPVTTTRVRLLFTEPPDPEFRAVPDRVGIYVCELEAYREPPFRWITPPQHVVPIRRDARAAYNEPANGDAGFDVTHPFIVEPKQTRIFEDTLTPTLIVRESRWARERAAAVEAASGQLRLRNGFLAIDLATAGGLQETRLTNRVTGESAATPRSETFLLRTSEGQLTARDFRIVKVDTSASDDQAARASVELGGDTLDLTVHYELRRQDHFYHKWLTATNKLKMPLQIRDVTLSNLQLPLPADLMAGPELTYPVSRMDKGGFFSCVETVYWDHQRDALTYYPGVTVPPGQEFESEKAVVGVYRNRGEIEAGWDRGVREWVIEYHAQISPPPPQWPDVYCEGWSAQIGMRQFLEQPEWTEHQFAMAEKLGIRYMDLYEPFQQLWAAPPSVVEGIVELARRYHVATGWWPDFGSGSGWGTGEPFYPPLSHLSPQSNAYFEKMVDTVRKYQFGAMHWGDFFEAFPTENPAETYLPGKYSIYAQGQRVLRFARELHEATPGMMTGGDCGLINPQFVRYDDSRANCVFMGYYGDLKPAAEPDIHLDRLYSEMVRMYIDGAHTIYLLPWYRLLNCVNHMGQITHLHDRAGFRYALLSALAMAGQVTFNDVPENVPGSEIRFTRQWLEWAQTNKDYLKEADKLFDRSFHAEDLLEGDAESLSGFAHIRGDRGYMFLMNPSPVEQIASLKLALDAAASAHFVVEEVFPGRINLQGPASGEYLQGGRLTVTVPGRQVRVLWIAPAAEGKTDRAFQPEDSRAAEARRYIVDWTVTAHGTDSAALHAHFAYPDAGRQYLENNSVAEPAWGQDPWAYDKAYLVFVLKDEARPLNDNWVPDKLSNSGTSADAPAVRINGVSKTMRPFKTVNVQLQGSNQPEGVARCFFVDLGGETHPGQSNEIELTLPIQQGVVFSGAYLDLPDQMPSGE